MARPRVNYYWRLGAEIHPRFCGSSSQTLLSVQNVLQQAAPAEQQELAQELRHGVCGLVTDCFTNA